MSGESYDRRLFTDMVRTSRRRAGAHDTHEERERGLRKFAIWLRQENVQLRRAESIRNAHFRAYIEARKQDGLSLGSLQNIAGYLRAAAPHLSLSNKELGIEGRCRDGKKRPCPEELFAKACNEIRDDGIRAAAKLQKALGLRPEEAIASGPSLPNWRRQIIFGRSPYIVRGTKGGKPRYAELPDPWVALRVVNEAIATKDSQRSKQLVPSRTLRSALRKFGRICQKAGLVGVYSPHSLRYSYACRLVRHFARLGFDEQEAYAAVALALGHGDGRGRYVKRVYGRELPPYETLRREYARREIRLRGLSARYRWLAPTGFYLLPQIWDVETSD